MSDYESEACEKLSEIRSNLTDILQLGPIRVTDIYQYCNETQTIMRDLKHSINPNSNNTEPQTKTRKTEKKKEKQNESSPDEIPNIKSVLIIDDILLLLSELLIFAGLNNRVTAQYSTISILKRMLDNIHNDPRNYKIETIMPIKFKLTKIKSIIYDGNKKASENENNVQGDIHRLIFAKYENCAQALTLVENSFNIPILQIDNTLLPFIDSLLNLKMEITTFFLMSVNLLPQKRIQPPSQTPDHKEEIISLSLKNEVRSLKASMMSLKSRIFNILGSPDSTLRGDTLILSLLEECEMIFSDFYINNYNYKEAMNDALKPLYRELVSIKYSLETSFIDVRWKLSKKKFTDLISYQKRVRKLYTLRTDWGTTKQRLEGQATVFHLFGRCFSLISKILESNKPVAESLSPIYNQLTLVRKILTTFKSSPIFIEHETKKKHLSDFTSVLQKIYNSKEDGYFLSSDKSIPLGQEVVSAVLDDCFHIHHDVEMELNRRPVKDDQEAGILIESLTTQPSFE